MPSKQWNQEFTLLKTMQEDRMLEHANNVCNNRCIKSSVNGTILLWERECMENCLSKHQQAGILTNGNFQRFEEIEAKQAKKGGKK